MRRWSKLQKEIEKLFDERLKLRIQCRAYPMRSQRGHTDLPRYWITLGKQIVWDYPAGYEHCGKHYPYLTDVSAISNLIRDYIDTPVSELLTKHFDDPWHVTEILLAADRRIGTRKVEELKRKLEHPGALAVFERHWGCELPFGPAAIPSGNGESLADADRARH